MSLFKFSKKFSKAKVISVDTKSSSTTHILYVGPNALGRCFRDLRKEHGFSLRKLAKMSGVSYGTIQRIENGGLPSVATLMKLSEYISVPYPQISFAPKEVSHD